MSWSIRIRDSEACDDVTPFLTPDLVIINAIGASIGFDFKLAEPDEVRNRMGLSAKRGLATAILIQLFSDRRAREDDALLDDRDPDRRGWWGSSVDTREDLNEGELGSRLWLLQRATLTQETLAKARDYCIEALQPIIDQGAVARFDVICEAQTGGATFDPTSSRLVIAVGAYSQDGNNIYSQRFEALWRQVGTLARQGIS